MKKFYVVGVIALCCILLSLMAFLTRDKKLEFESDQTNKLYSYLGEVDYYHCGGLQTYSGDEVTMDDISNDNRLCMAYFNLDSDLSTEEIKSTGKNDNKTPICKVGENLTFAANEETNNCNITSFSEKELNEAYQTIYGKEIDKYDSFYINYSTICQKEGETYYCGNAETYSVALLPDTNVYRLKNKVVEHYNGDIIIEDYFLRITDNKCYLTNSLDEENTDCTKALAKINDFDQESDSKKAEFVAKYGKLYRHTFKENQKNKNTYYWLKSEVK